MVLNCNSGNKLLGDNYSIILEMDNSNSLLDPNKNTLVKLLSHWAIEGNNFREFPWRDLSLEPYKHVIVEFLLQRTKAGTIKDFFPSFVKKYPNWETIAETEIKDLIEDLSKIGLQNQRGPRIKKAAVYFSKNSPPKDKEKLIRIPGIGNYIASAILLFYHNEPSALIDGSIARLFDRLLNAKTKVDHRYDDNLIKTVEQTLEQFDDYKVGNWIMLDFSAQVCKKDPSCNICPLTNYCKYYQSLKYD